MTEGTISPEEPPHASASPTQLAQLQGKFMHRTAKIQARATIEAARISARARYFHAYVTLVGALGVLGGFGLNMYLQMRDWTALTFRLQEESKAKEELLLRELAAAHQLLARMFAANKKAKEGLVSEQRAEEIEAMLHKDLRQ